MVNIRSPEDQKGRNHSTLERCMHSSCMQFMVYLRRVYFVAADPFLQCYRHSRTTERQNVRCTNRQGVVWFLRMCRRNPCNGERMRTWCIRQLHSCLRSLRRCLPHSQTISGHPVYHLCHDLSARFKSWKSWLFVGSACPFFFHFFYLTFSACRKYTRQCRWVYTVSVSNVYRASSNAEHQPTHRILIFPAALRSPLLVRCIGSFCIQMWKKYCYMHCWHTINNIHVSSKLTSKSPRWSWTSLYLVCACKIHWIWGCTRPFNCTWPFSCTRPFSCTWPLRAVRGHYGPYMNPWSILLKLP